MEDVNASFAQTSSSHLWKADAIMVTRQTLRYWPSGACLIQKRNHLALLSRPTNKSLNTKRRNLKKSISANVTENIHEKGNKSAAKIKGGAVWKVSSLGAAVQCSLLDIFPVTESLFSLLTDWPTVQLDIFAHRSSLYWSYLTICTKKGEIKSCFKKHVCLFIRRFSEVAIKFSSK